MLITTSREGRAGLARLLLAEACRLPWPVGAVDSIFSAGLVNHVPDPVAALHEWARVTAAGGVLLLFHPSGRAERDSRHGRPLDPDDALAGTCGSPWGRRAGDWPATRTRAGTRVRPVVRSGRGLAAFSYVQLGTWPRNAA
ncbi:methyltransferase domain-containing protein [Streptomyces sp. NPDC005706]|uniref:class I SAM-dependent methyltransferase n=1 Tax=Streptomyces sp. NPDC005706 TaxID=3157169 RepID=UPI0033EEF73E